MSKFFLYFLLFTFLLNSKEIIYDLSIVGYADSSDGLGSLPLIFIRGMSDRFTMNFIPTRPIINYNGLDKFIDRQGGYGKVALLFDVLWYKKFDAFRFVPEKSIKIAVSMIESSAIPREWVFILNNKFDAVCVPDNYFIEVYKKSGVKIPIFVLPLCIELDSFLNFKQEKPPQKHFLFGCSATFYPHKNQKKLITAFHKEFKNNPNVHLVIHTKWTVQDSYVKEIEELLERLKAKNITLIHKNFSSDDYKLFLRSLDCYVLISKGEGYSNTPRQALAMGIPCIISNNTAHKTLCNTGFVYAVDSPIQVRPILYKSLFGTEEIGFQWDCSEPDVRKALRDTYQNYSLYKKKAALGREWIKNYTFSQLKNHYITLIKPNKIILGDKNEILNGKLVTDSSKLYKKYKETYGSKIC